MGGGDVQSAVEASQAMSLEWTWWAPSPRISQMPASGSVQRFVPLYHPAAALYNGALLRTLEEDMRLVRGYLDDAQAERDRQQREQAEAAARTATVRAADEQLTLF